MGNADHWQLVKRRSLQEFRVVSVQAHTYQHLASGKQRDYVVCDSADWAFVIPITPNNEVVFIRQFRHGLGDVVLEIPGGIMEPGESPAETSVRELREETGYVPESVEMFGPLLPNPGLNNAKYHVAVARNCVPRFPPSTEPFEEIEVVLRPLDSVPRMIAEGELQHALCIAAFALARLD